MAQRKIRINEVQASLDDPGLKGTTEITIRVDNTNPAFTVPVAAVVTLADGTVVRVSNLETREGILVAALRLVLNDAARAAVRAAAGGEPYAKGISTTVEQAGGED